MSIYVDNLHGYPTKMVSRRAKKHGTRWCHLMTDSDDLEELHRFAKTIGLKRSWFQNHKTSPHYDLVESKRNLAIQKGAIPVTQFEIAKKCSLLFKPKSAMQK